MNVKKILLIPFLFTLLVTGLWAFSFEPISRSFSPSGRGATQSFRLKNEGPDYIAIRISMFTREIGTDGRESRKAADELFTVYPRQIVLKPESIQTVRVKWEGPADISSEQAYRILIEQVPVDFGGETSRDSGIQILFRYLGAVYICPPEASADVVVQHAEIVRVDDSEALEITLNNRGNKHSILNDLTIIIRNAGDGSVLHEYPPELLEGINGDNILAGGTRIVRLKVPEGLEYGPLDVELGYDSEN
jgi:fimbrial chaperone protein